MKPIIFNTRMVRAILDGKTQTRRPIKLGKYRLADPDMCEPMNGGLFVPNSTDFVLNLPSGGLSKAMQDKVIYCQYEKGDKLWVRETFASGLSNKEPYAYRATAKWTDFEDGTPYDFDDIKWKPSIHMPKSAARIFLEVTDVRVERLQDIDEAGAEAEGVKATEITPLELRWTNYSNPSGAIRTMSYVEPFKNLWNSVYKNWDENPWVFVIEFKRV